MRMLLSAVTLALVTIFVECPRGFDLDGRRDLGCNRAATLSDPTAVDLVALPVAGIEAGATEIELGGIRRYELSELDQGYVASAHRFPLFTLAAGLGQLGRSDLYSEQTAVLSLAGRFHQVALGVKWSGRWVSFGRGYSSLSTTTIGVSAAWRRERLSVAVEADNLTEPRLYPTAVPLNDVYTLHLELQGPGAYLIDGQVTAEQNERPRFRLGQELEPARYARFNWSIATAPLTCAGGFDIMYAGSRLSYVVSYHPVLGLSHLFSVGWTFGGRQT